MLVGSPLSLQGRTPFADEVDALTDPLDEDWVRDSLSWFPLLNDVPPRARRPQDARPRVEGYPERPDHGHAAHGIGNHRGAHADPGGAQDNLLPRSDQETLAARIPGAVLKVYPDVAHLVLWECPERVAEDAMEFLRSCA